MQRLTQQVVQIVLREIKKHNNQPLTDNDFSYICQTIIQQTGIIPNITSIKDYITSIQQKNPIKQNQLNEKEEKDIQSQINQPLFKSFSFGRQAQSSQNGPESFQKGEIKIDEKVIQKIQKKLSKQTISFKSKRKIKLSENVNIDNDTTIEQKFQNLQNINNDCHLSMEKKPKKYSGKENINVHETSTWFFHQYFYSNYDRPFFKGDQFIQIIYQVGFNPKTMTYYEHRMLRRALPPPKLFNYEFITEQINALKESRKEVRQLARQRDMRDEKYRDQIVQLTANRSVIALHPICGHLHLGSILAIYKQNEHVVKFFKPQLGTQKVLDTYITSEFTGNRKWIQSHDPIKNQRNSNTQIVENLDHQVMGVAIKLLDYKTKLILKLKAYNDQAQILIQNRLPLSITFLQEYGWIGTTINIISIGIKHVLAKFRLRGLVQNNQDQVGKNLSCLMLNPLHLMEKQLENSGEVEDVNISSRIRQMMFEQKQNKVEEKLLSLMEKQKAKINMEVEGQKDTILNTLRSCLGILINLQVDARNFDINQNKYLKSLLQLTHQKYPEHFNQIFDKIHGIIKKVKQR